MTFERKDREVTDLGFDAKLMRDRMNELIRNLSTHGIHKAVSDYEARMMYTCAQQLLQREPTAENQTSFVHAALLLDTTLVARERPEWVSMLEVGTTMDGKPLFKPADEAVAQWYALCLANNAIARCACGDKEASFDADRVAAQALEYFGETNQNNRWAAACLIVLARRAYEPERARGYGEAAKAVLEECKTASDNLREQAKYFAKEPKDPKESKKIGRFKVKLPVAFHLPPPKFVVNDLYLFTP